MESQQKVSVAIQGGVGSFHDYMIHEIAAIMNSDSPTIDVIKRTIHVHPTLSEVIEGLRKV